MERDNTNHKELGRPRRVTLSQADLDILSLVLDHRFLRRDHASLLTGRHEKRLHRNLLKLSTHGYLTTVRLPQQKHIYGLGNAGLDVLAERGLGSPDLAGVRLRTHELSELFLKHEMMIVDIHVKLTVSSKTGETRLLSWNEGSQLYDEVTVSDRKGNNRLPVRPDAFFTLEDSCRPEGANRAHFVLEADRSTANHARFQEKIRAYWSYIEQGLHEKKYGVKGFRVLTVTLTDARARNLTALTASLVPERARKYFMFISQSKLSQASNPVRDAVCYSPRGTLDQLHPLVSSAN